MITKKKINSSIKSFAKEKFSRDEYFQELQRFSKEMINLTFGEEQKEYFSLRNVIGKLNSENKECGEKATTELNLVCEDLKKVQNEICAQESGRKGENKIFKCLDTVTCKRDIIKNVCLSYENHHTELDAVVITSKAVFLIEVKNSLKDTLIDGKGNLFRMSERNVRLNQNIGEKMIDKEYILRKCLEKATHRKTKIVPLVVFSNSETKVTNEYKYIQICYASTISKLIEYYDGEDIYSDEDFEKIKNTLEKERTIDYFEAPIDVGKFKENYLSCLTKMGKIKEEKTTEAKNWIKALLNTLQFVFFPIPGLIKW